MRQLTGLIALLLLSLSTAASANDELAQGRAMIRTSYMATHTRDHLDRALEIFRDIGREMEVIQ